MITTKVLGNDNRLDPSMTIFVVLFKGITSKSPSPRGAYYNPYQAKDAIAYLNLEFDIKENQHPQHIMRHTATHLQVAIKLLAKVGTAGVGVV